MPRAVDSHGEGLHGHRRTFSAEYPYPPYKKKRLHRSRLFSLVPITNVFGGGGVGFGEGRKGGFRKALPPPFSKRSGAGTEEVVPTPFEERGDILRGMDVARTRPPSQGKEGEPGWRRKPGIRACITRRAAVKRPTRRLRRTESQGVNPVLPDHQQGSVDGPVFMETEAGRGGFPPSNHAVFAGPLKDA